MTEKKKRTYVLRKQSQADTSTDLSLVDTNLIENTIFS